MEIPRAQNIGHQRLNSCLPQCSQEHAFSVRPGGAIGIHPSSPGWHRRARQHRAKSRLRSRYQRAQGRQPCRRDIARLALHHSAPPWALALHSKLMGRGHNKDKSWHGDGGYNGPYTAGWRDKLWKGAFSSPRGQGQAPWKDQAWDKGPAASFPAFDAKLSAEAAKEEDGRGREPSGDGSIPTRTVQTALNAARRAEQRVDRLARDEQTTHSQWDAYVKAMKQGYVREKKRFQARLDKLKKEQLEAQEQLDIARVAFRSIVMDEEPSLPSAGKVLEVTGSAADEVFAEWDASAAPDWSGVATRARVRQHGRGLGEDDSAYEPSCAAREFWTDFYSSPPGCIVIRHTPAGECRRGPLHGYGDDAAGARAFPCEPGRRVAPSSTARPPESWASAARVPGHTRSGGLPRATREYGKGSRSPPRPSRPWMLGTHPLRRSYRRGEKDCHRARRLRLSSLELRLRRRGPRQDRWAPVLRQRPTVLPSSRMDGQFIGPGNDRGRRRRSSIRSWGQGTASAGRDLTGCVEGSQGRSQLHIYPSTLREPLDGGASLGKFLLSSFSLGEYCGSGAVRRVNWRSLRRRVQLFCTVAFIGLDGYFLRPAMIGKAQAVTRSNPVRETARPPGFRETLGDVFPSSNASFRLPGACAGLEVVLHARKGFPCGSGLCGFRYSGVVDLRGPFQPHDPRDAYIFPILGPCSPVSSGWNFDRRPCFASFEAMERYSRCQRGLSVAQGSPPTSSFTSGCLQASQVASLSLQGIGESRCLRGLSVARGSPPAMSFADSVDALRTPARVQCPSIGCYIGKSCFETLSLFILWCGAFVVPCMRSLGLCLFISLIGALRWSVSVRLLSAGRARRIVLAGTDLWLLHSLGVIASPCHQPVLPWAPYRTHARGCKPRFRPFPKKGFLCRLLVHICATYLYGTLPCCVWAAPEGISNLQSLSEVIADRVPEALPVTAGLKSGSSGPPASCARAGAETWSDTVARMQDQALYDTYSERLDPPCLRLRFLRPGFPDEVAALRDLPAHPDHALQEAMLTLPAARQGQPLIPIEAEAQPWPGVITVVLVPPWVSSSTWTTIILDLTDIGGPLFSEFVPALLTFRDLAVFADVYTQQDWEVFKAG